MFEVIDKETGSIHTVYACNGSMFLFYDGALMCWVWHDVDGYVPYYGGKNKNVCC